VGVAVVAAVAFVALAVVVAHRTEPLRLDKPIDDFLFLKRHSAPRPWISALQRVGSDRVIIPATLLLAAYAWTRRRSAALAVWCLATPAAAVVLTAVLKRAIGRSARTGITPHTGVAHLVHPPYTFPSGHVLGTAAVAAVAVALVATGASLRRVVWASIAAGVAVLAVGYTVIATGDHVFTDVVGGVLLGLALGCVAAVLQPGSGGRGAR
jgi:undecaprenyl-diphosphatase